MEITIRVKNENDKMKIGSLIHDQLCGNEDYINNNVVLNVEDENIVYLYISDECENIPRIIIC